MKLFNLLASLALTILPFQISEGFLLPYPVPDPNTTQQSSSGNATTVDASNYNTTNSTIINSPPQVSSNATNTTLPSSNSTAVVNISNYDVPNNSTHNYSPSAPMLDDLVFVYVSQPYMVKSKYSSDTVPYHLAVGGSIIADRTLSVTINTMIAGMEQQTHHATFPGQDSQGRKLAGIVHKDNLANLKFRIIRNGALIVGFQPPKSNTFSINASPGNDNVKIKLLKEEGMKMIQFSTKTSQESYSVEVLKIDIVNIAEDLSQNTLLKELMHHF